MCDLGSVNYAVQGQPAPRPLHLLLQCLTAQARQEWKVTAALLHVPGLTAEAREVHLCAMTTPKLGFGGTKRDLKTGGTRLSGDAVDASVCGKA